MSLTDDWKAGKLEPGQYWVRCVDDRVIVDDYVEWIDIETQEKGKYFISSDVLEVLAPCDYEELQRLQEKVERAIKGINGACAWLTCMDDLSRFNEGKCNEQMALEMLNKTMEKIK